MEWSGAERRGEGWRWVARGRRGAERGGLDRVEWCSGEERKGATRGGEGEARGGEGWLGPSDKAAGTALRDVWWKGGEGSEEESGGGDGVEWNGEERRREARGGEG